MLSRLDHGSTAERAVGSDGDEDRLFLSLAVCATFAAALSVAMAIGIWVVRAGLGTPGGLVFLALSVLLATAYAPFLLPQRARRLLVGAPFAIPLVSLVVLVSPLLALPLGRPVAIAYPVLAAGGTVRAAPLLARWRRRRILGLVALAAGFAAHLFVVINERFLAHVYSPEFALLGIGNNDSYFHTAIVNMIQHRGRASVGLDGVVSMKYHVASHHWFASIDKLAGSEPLFTYFVGLLVVLVPAFVLVLQHAVLGLRAGSARRPEVVVGLTVAAVVVVDVLDPNRSWFTSESFCFGLLAMVAALPLLADLVRAPERRGAGNVVRLAAIPLLVFLTLALKITVGLLLAGAIGWVLLRGYAKRGAIVLVPVVLATVALAWGLYAAGTDDAGLRFSPLRFFVLHPAQAVVISILSLSFPVLFAWTGRRAGSWSRRTVSLPEVVSVVAIGAALNAYAFAQPFLNIAYFLVTAMWFALPFVLADDAADDVVAAYAEVKRAIGARGGVATTALVGVLLAVLVIQTLLPRPVAAATDTMLAALRREGPGPLPDGYVAQFRRSLTDDRVLFGADFRRALDASYGARAVARVQELAARAGPRAGVFVPPSNEEFWSYARTCDVQPFFLPALAGLPMVKGLPPDERECQVQYFGYDAYGEDSHSRELSAREVCEDLPPRVDSVIVLRDVDRPSANAVVRCRG